MDSTPIRTLSDYYNPAQQGQQYFKDVMAIQQLGLHREQIDEQKAQHAYKQSQDALNKQDSEEIAAMSFGPEKSERITRYALRNHSQTLIEKMLQDDALIAFAHKRGMTEDVARVMRDTNTLGPVVTAWAAEQDIAMASNRAESLNHEANAYQAIVDEATPVTTSIKGAVQMAVSLKQAQQDAGLDLYKRIITEHPGTKAAEGAQDQLDRAAETVRQEWQPKIGKMIEDLKTKNEGLVARRDLFLEIAKDGKVNEALRKTKLAFYEHAIKTTNATLAYLVGGQEPTPDSYAPLSATLEEARSRATTLQDDRRKELESMAKKNAARTTEIEQKVSLTEGIMKAQMNLQQEADARGITLEALITKQPGLVTTAAVRHGAKASEVREAITGSKTGLTGAGDLTGPEQVTALTKAQAMAAQSAGATGMIDPVTGQVNFEKMLQHSARDAESYVRELTTLAKTKAFAGVRDDLHVMIGDAKAHMKVVSAEKTKFETLLNALPPATSEEMQDALKSGKTGNLVDPASGKSLRITGGGDKPLVAEDPISGHKFELRGKGKKAVWIAIN
jgi:hypothetical protein